MKTNISYLITDNPYKLTVEANGVNIQSFVMPSELGSTLSVLALTGLKRLLRDSYAGRASEASKLLTEKIEKIKVGASGVVVMPTNPIKNKKLIALYALIATLDPINDADMITKLRQKIEEEEKPVHPGPTITDNSHVFKLND